jgi:hypothetical protein
LIRKIEKNVLGYRKNRSIKQQWVNGQEYEPAIFGPFFGLQGAALKTGRRLLLPRAI